MAKTPPAIIARKTASTVPRNLRAFLSLEDFRLSAKRHLPVPIFGYVDGSVETGASMNNARAAYERMAFVPSVLRDVSARSTRTELFSQAFAVPFGIAPMGFSALAAYDGDVALARAAHEFGSIAICSAASLTPLERVASEGRSRWFQCYVPGDEGRISALIERLKRAQFETLVVTADVPVAGNRENNARNGFDAPFRLTGRLTWQFCSKPSWTLGTLGREILQRGMPYFENMDAEQGPPLFSSTLTRSILGRDQLTWESLRFIRKIWPGKLILKGVLSVADACRAEELGVDGVIISNHGGRQLDACVAPLDVLPEIRAATSNLAILIDGGIRRGTDILKAIALGADFAFIGRPFLFAASVRGAPGVSHAFRLLQNEMLTSMALLGINRLDELSPDRLQRV
ncbi:alpha-hydroxy acid oxidase [Rhizobium sp. NRK18]|uniref:alpha-hydroxy acid oxidase n=1 Tax=Rhizobium sp. NRK18 TaxID=2964667 RepID=UPI0021C49984|nr:alpha-hydroxy acid oxidase [Rhizobium sp. NRK18]MCQ2003218.1 alpha-hydroxy-acid oxidizing protein [Rhizobium sp. NRK18]